MPEPATRQRRCHSVLIVDDHPLFREGLKSLINRSDNYRVTGEAGNAEEAVRLARRCQPDLVTMDMSLPGEDGASATRRVLQASPASRVLMLTMHPDYAYIAEAFLAGVRGYVLKEATSSQLVEAFDTLMRNEIFVDRNTSTELVSRIVAPHFRPPAVEDRYGTLTRREQQIMRLVVEGQTSRQIAEQLGLRIKTVENHRGNLMRKLGVKGKVELVHCAMRLGLIDTGAW
ncbi:MAG: response regulator transcription factor [Geothermobacteraceae bacterium]